MESIENLSIKDIEFKFERMHAVGIFSMTYNGITETIHSTMNVDCKEIVVEKTLRRLSDLGVSHNFEPIDKLYKCPHW